MYRSNQKREADGFGPTRAALAITIYLGVGVAALSLSSGSVLAQSPPPPYSPTYNTQSADVYWQNLGGSGSVSDPVSAEYNYPRSAQQNSGFATLRGTNASGVPVITSGGYAESNDGGWVQTTPSFATSMYVGPGTSALAVGTAVTLQLSLQLDGSTYVKTGNDAGYAAMSFQYFINGPDQAVYYPGPEGGWSVPKLVSFNASVQHSVDNFYSCYGMPCGDYHDLSYESGWNWSSNHSPSSGSGGIANDYSTYDGFSDTFSDSRIFDTHIVRIEFDTFVGDTLNINSYLDVWGDTYGANSVARADFLTTLETSIISPYVSGLVLMPGTISQPVPEPETYAMLLAGLGLLGWHARRRKIQQVS
jgi:hypothetical protein